MYWTIWTGLRTDQGNWLWEKAGKRTHAYAAKAKARKLAKEHAIASDFADGRVVAYTFKDWQPDNISMVCNRNGSFYQLQEVWS